MGKLGLWLLGLLVLLHIAHPRQNIDQLVQKVREYDGQ